MPAKGSIIIPPDPVPEHPGTNKQYVRTKTDLWNQKLENLLDVQPIPADASGKGLIVTQDPELLKKGYKYGYANPTQLAVPRKITFQGDVTTVSKEFDGSQDIFFTLEVQQAEHANNADNATNAGNSNTTSDTSVMRKDNNLGDVEDIVTSRNNLGLGTAATRDIISSFDDTTDGNVLLTGYCGIGIARVINDADINNYTIPGKWITPNTTLTNTPSNITNGRCIVDVSGSGSSTYITQTISGFGQDSIRWFRCGKGSPQVTWTDWQEIYHTGNLVTATSSKEGLFIDAPSDGNSYTRKDAQWIQQPANPQPTITSSSTFTASSNNINVSGIVSSLDLEVGDVIVVTGTNSNNKTFSVEMITDNDNIVVNYEHRNGAGSLSLINESGVNATIKRLVKWYQAPLGIGQAWVDLSSIRSEEIDYQNTSGRPIIIASPINGGNLKGRVKVGISTSSYMYPLNSGDTESYGGTILIPNNDYYQYGYIRAGTSKLELR